MILIKYILKENRSTDCYNLGKLWFGTHKITWSKWFFGNRICIIKNICAVAFKTLAYALLWVVTLVV